MPVRCRKLSPSGGRGCRCCAATAMTAHGQLHALPRRSIAVCFKLAELICAAKRFRVRRRRPGEYPTTPKIPLYFPIGRITMAANSRTACARPTPRARPGRRRSAGGALKGRSDARPDPSHQRHSQPGRAADQGGYEVIGAAGASGAPGGEKDEACVKAGIDKAGRSTESEGAFGDCH